MNWNPNQHDPFSPPHGAFQPQGGKDPYGQNPYTQNPYGPNPYAQNPYGQQPPPKTGGSFLWLWILLGVGCGLAVLCCGCCGVFGYIGLDQENQQIKALIADDPVIVEHIGQIVSIKRDWGKSMDDDDQNVWYFRLVGTVGEGDLIIKEESGVDFDEEEIQIEWAKLRLDSGEEFDVLP